MGLEEELSHVDGGADDDREGAEAEVHQWAVLLGESSEGAVRQRTNELRLPMTGHGIGPGPNSLVIHQTTPQEQNKKIG
ncbi:hypothetical protein GW17_00052480 [Ensete ventricosum]|nr:hypothetical protein GW17_00052480 [Ensete ventricosum]